MSEIKLEERVYSAKAGSKGIFSVLSEMFQDLRKSGDLGFRIAKRDIQGMYRQSLLGILWAFITPLMTALIWIFLNGAGVVQAGNTLIPYPAYVFSGTIVWSIFSDSIMAPVNQTQQSKGIISKINFPKEGLLIAAFYKLIFNGAIKLGLLCVVFLIMGIFPDWRIILVPIILLCLMLFGFVMGLFLTPIALLYGDIGRAIPIGLQFLMFLAPVVYLLPEKGLLMKLMEANPVTPMILTVRNFMSAMDFQQPLYFTLVMLVTVVLCLLAWVIYRLSIPIIVER